MPTHGPIAFAAALTPSVAAGERDGMGRGEREGHDEKMIEKGNQN